MPFINILFWLFLLLKSGDDGENDYGPPPPPHGISLYFMVCVILLLIVLGVREGSKMRNAKKADAGRDDYRERMRQQAEKVSEEFSMTAEQANAMGPMMVDRSWLVSRKRATRDQREGL